MNGTNTNANSTHLPGWIDNTLTSIVVSNQMLGSFSAFGTDPRNLALLSDEYLAAALTVARSLAEQIDQAEREGNTGITSVQNDPWGESQLLPKPGSRWADQITVQLETTAPQHDQAQGNITPYLSVAGTTLPSSSYDTSGDVLINQDRRMYSLGLVFYELFSGGENPPETPETEEDYSNKEELGELGDTEPLPYYGEDNCAIVNLKSALKIIDVITEDEIEGRGAKRQFVQDGDRECQVSFEQLKSKGIPGPLCDLIANMVNAVKGDLSGPETYSRMSHVVDDLSLMLDKPAKFLHDLDVEKASMEGLQLNAVFGRESELAALQDSYRRSIAGASECGIITGPSGVGKSVLAQRLSDYVTTGGGIFLSGKFDERMLTTPFSALASAFNEYCDKMGKGKGLRHLQNVALQLRLELGIEANHLAKIIPNLAPFLGEQVDVQEVNNQDCVDPQQRLLYLLSRFVDVISTSSDTPIVLFLDDCQWADSASIEILSQLLLISGSSKAKRQLYFLACMRDTGGDGHPFMTMLARTRQFDVNITRLQLGCLDEHTLNSFLSDLLCLSPRLTKSLANLIYCKTKGNPFFISKLLASLSKDNTVQLSLSRKRWIWNEEKIQSMQLSEDVVAFIIAELRKLPAEVQSALKVLSCLGARSDIKIAKALEAKLMMSLTQSLEIAMKEGLISKTNEQYIFCHDRIQESVYKLISEEDYCLFHFKIGVALASMALGSQDEDMLFTAASQLNFGGPKSVSDKEQSLLIAHLNLKAGNKAMEKSDYGSAYNYFDNGISFLRKKHWKDHYDLSLSLFDAAAQSAFAAGNLDGLKILCEQILFYAHDIDDQINSLMVLVHALACTSRLNDAINNGIVVLTRLGEDLPDADIVSEYWEETKGILHDITDDQFMHYQKMSDKSKIHAMKLLARLQHPIQMARPNLQPIATLRMINLSITHGMSPESPLAFIYYGVMLARKGNVREGYRYVKLAMELLEGFGSREFAGQVMTMGTEILCYVEPLQATLEFHTHGFDSCMAVGDTSSAMVNRIVFTAGHYWGSTKLKTVQEGYASLRRLMSQHSQYTFLVMLSPLEISPLTLLGLEDELDQVPEDFKGNLMAANNFHFQSMNVAYLFRRYDQMVSSAEEFFGFNIKSWSLLFTDSCQTWIAGLVSFYAYRTSKEKVWYDRGQKATEDMRMWADASEWNFSSKLFLLEAELAYSENNFQVAETLYQKAISAAKDHRFTNDEALACECVGYFYLKFDMKEKALQYFMQSHQAYDEWGAVAKCNHLFEVVQKAMGLSVQTTDTPLPIPQLTSDENSGNTRSRKRFQNQAEATGLLGLKESDRG